MENTTKLIIGIGCGCAVVVGIIVAVSVGIFYVGASSSQDMPALGPSEPPSWPETVSPVTPPQPMSDVRDGAFAQYVNGAAGAVLNAVRGVPHDARWNGAQPQRDLRATPPEVRTQIAALGPSPQIVMTMVELEATDGQSRVRSNVAVFPDGRVGWAKVSRDTIPTSPTAGLFVAAPALAAEATRMLETLAGSCDLPTVGRTEIAALPADAQSEILRDVDEIPRACALGTPVAAFQPKVDDVTIVVQGNGQYAMLRTEFEVEGNALYLRAPRIRLQQ